MKLVFIASLIIQSTIAVAQSTVTSVELQKANDFFVAKDWNNAAKSYRSIAEKELQNWNARTRLGIALVESGKAKEAIPILEEAVKMGNNFQTMLTLADAQAALGNADQAFEWLQKSISAGFNQLDTFENDVHLGSLKKDKRYEGIRELIKQQIMPCHFSKEAHQFDFWIGEWKVKNPAGAIAGSSSITQILGECIIFENWTSAPPNLYSGKSFNLFNSITGKWQQTWVDDKGGVTEYINGIYADNKMVLVTKPDKSNRMLRMSFFNMNPDLVRQFGETSTDGGITWATSFDLFYNRIN